MYATLRRTHFTNLPKSIASSTAFNCAIFQGTRMKETSADLRHPYIEQCKGGEVRVKKKREKRKSWIRRESTLNMSQVMTCTLKKSHILLQFGFRVNSTRRTKQADKEREITKKKANRVCKRKMNKKLERKPRGSEGRVSSNQMNGFFEETVFFRLEVRNVNLEILSKDYWTLEAAKRNAHRRI